jgi:hypothetical protein
MCEHSKELMEIHLTDSVILPNKLSLFNIQFRVMPYMADGGEAWSRGRARGLSTPRSWVQIISGFSLYKNKYITHKGVCIKPKWLTRLGEVCSTPLRKEG